MPPPTGDKMHVPLCAPRITVTKKVAAAGENASQGQDEGLGNKKNRKNKKKADNKEGSEVVVGHVEAAKTAGNASNQAVANNSIAKIVRISSRETRVVPTERVSPAISPVIVRLIALKGAVISANK